MSLVTHPALMTLRRLLRGLGVNQLVGRLRNQGQYEAKLSSIMEGSVSAGDIVWDVGANIGFYTKRFSALATGSGQVFAFEPSSTNLRVLREAVTGLDNVTILPLALSDQTGTIEFVQGPDEEGSLSRIGAGNGTLPTETVERTTGDQLVQSGGARPPTVIKIDVEGHELEVLSGMRRTLQDPAVRHIFVEVHFRLLEEQGKAGAPAEIERMLRSVGLSLNWIDASHLHAFRR